MPKPPKQDQKKFVMTSVPETNDLIIMIETLGKQRGSIAATLQFEETKMRHDKERGIIIMRPQLVKIETAKNLIASLDRSLEWLTRVIKTAKTSPDLPPRSGPKQGSAEA